MGASEEAGGERRDQAVGAAVAGTVEAERAFAAAPVVPVRGLRMPALAVGVAPRVPDHRIRMVAASTA